MGKIQVKGSDENAMRFVLSVLMLLLTATSIAGGQERAAPPAVFSGPQLEPALVQAMKDYDRAQLHGDRAEMERLVAPDYLIVRTSGLGDRASLIHNVAGPGVKTAPFTIVRPFARNYGGTVIAGGWCDLHGTYHGKPWAQKTRFADCMDEAGWQMVVVMTTLTPSETP